MAMAGATTSLPKLDVGRRSLVSSKLCETMKSTAGHDFDLSFTRQSRMEYNSLHDPHLKHYFYKPQMVKQLIQKRCVTADLQIVCKTQKEYNIYCDFIDQETMKTKKRKEIETLEQQKALKSATERNENFALLSAKKKMDKDGEGRQKFYMLEEKKLKAREEELKENERKSRIEKKKALVLHHIQKELEDLKKRNERSLRMLMKVMKMHEQCQREQRNGSQDLRSKLSGKLRMLQLRRMREGERIRTLTELEILWRKHGDYACMMQEDKKSILEKEGGEDGDHTKEKQGTLLLSYLKSDIASMKPKQRLTSSEEGSSTKEHFKKQQGETEQQSQTRAKKFHYREINEWKEWIMRQQNQCMINLQQKKESWYEERHKLFELLWREVPSEMESRKKVSFKREDKADDHSFPHYGSTKAKRRSVLPILFGNSSAWPT